MKKLIIPVLLALSLASCSISGEKPESGTADEKSRTEATGSSVPETGTGVQESAPEASKIGSGCEVAAKSRIPKNASAYKNLDPSYRLESGEFSGKIRSVKFRTAWSCGTGIAIKSDGLGRFEGEIPWSGGNSYKFSDSIATALLSANEWGYGFAPNSEPEEDVRDAKQEVVAWSDWNTGYLMIVEMTDGSFKVGMSYLNVGLEGTKRLDAAGKDAALEELRGIVKTLSIKAETPGFDWKNVVAKNSSFLGDSEYAKLTDDEFAARFGTGSKNGIVLKDSLGTEKTVRSEIFFDCGQWGKECDYAGYDEPSDSIVITVRTMNQEDGSYSEKETYRVDVKTGKATKKQ